MKSVIKQLSKEIGQILQANEYANEMSAQIDGGEWSYRPPDFDHLIKRWKLTAQKLEIFIDEARVYSAQYDRIFPIHKWEKRWVKKAGCNYQVHSPRQVQQYEMNVWHWVIMNLDLVLFTSHLFREQEVIVF